MRCVIEAHDNAFYIRDGAGKIRSWLDELIDYAENEFPRVVSAIANESQRERRDKFTGRESKLDRVAFVLCPGPCSQRVLQRWH
jgi:hypothetical protein